MFWFFLDLNALVHKIFRHFNYICLIKDSVLCSTVKTEYTCLKKCEHLFKNPLKDLDGADESRFHQTINRFILCLCRLRSLFLAGERCDVETLEWAKKSFGVPILDHWWQTGRSLSPNPNAEIRTARRGD